MAYMTADTVTAEEEKYGIVDVSLTANIILPYLQLIWPFVGTSGGVSVVQSYSPTSPNVTVHRSLTRRPATCMSSSTSCPPCRV